jgi:hypothetical protein
MLGWGKYENPFCQYAYKKRGFQMKNQPIYKALSGRILQFVSVLMNALMALVPVKLVSNSLSSVSWNG